MATYNVSCGFTDLDGTCDIVGTNCISYTSSSKGAGTVTNKPGPNLHFHVNFTGVSHPYVIRAISSGTGYTGNASDQDDGATEESWAATAVSKAASGQSC